MSFRKVRCRHGLRREDVFVLLMALVEAEEVAIGDRPPLDLSILIEPQPSRSASRRAARPSAGGTRQAGARFAVQTPAKDASPQVRAATNGSVSAEGSADSAGICRLE